MSITDPGVRLAGALRAHLSARVSALIRESREARVSAWLSRPEWEHSPRLRFARVDDSDQRIESVGSGGGKTAMHRDLILRLLEGGATGPADPPTWPPGDSGTALSPPP